MAVRVIGRIIAYQGLSSDTKPTANVPFGSTFTETDTGVVSRFDGMAWVWAPPDRAAVDNTGQITVYLQALLQAHLKLNTMFALANDLDEQDLEAGDSLSQ